MSILSAARRRHTARLASATERRAGRGRRIRRERPGGVSLPVSVSLSGCLLAVSLGMLGLSTGCRPASESSRSDGGGTPASARETGSWEEVAARVDQLAAEERYAEAEDLVRAGLTRWSGADVVRAHARLAALELAAGGDLRALEATELPAGAPPPSADLLWARAEALRRLARVEEARAILEPLLVESPEHLAATLTLARVLFRTDDAASALPLFERWLRSAPPEDPERDVARLELGRALRGAGEHQRAADVFAELLEEEPTESEYYSELSATLFRLRQREAARFVQSLYRTRSQRAFEEYGADKLLRTGRTALAFSQRALNREEEQRFLEAFQDHRAAHAANEESKDSRVPAYYAELLLAFRRPAQALQVAVEGIEADCTPASGLWWTRGRIELALERPREAATSFERAEALEALERAGGETRGRPAGQANAFATLLGLVEARLALGDVERAEQSLDALASLDASAWQEAYWRGRLLLDRGDSGGAVAIFQQAVLRAQRREQTPTPDLFLWLGVARGRAGDPAKGAQLLQGVLAKAPGRAEFYDELIAYSSDPAAKERFTELHRVAITAREKRRAIEAAIASKPLEQCSAEYLALARAAELERDQDALRFYALASDLDPRNADAARALLRIAQSPETVFLRLRLLRRLLAAEPRDPLALGQIASIYIQLHVRLDEARRLATLLVDVSPTEEAFALLVRASILAGDRDAARRHATEGLERHPASTSLRALLGTTDEER